MSTSQLEQGRVGKREFVQRAARRGGIPLRTMQQAYDAMIDELLDLVGSGNRVTLTGFGRFYPQAHKGHTVQTNISKDPGAPGGSKKVDDYFVLKFSATRDVNKSMTGNA
jgi:DNA-binding protein HU-beta